MREAIDNQIFDYYRKREKRIKAAKTLLKKDGYIIYKRNKR